jgi:two-component system response regulator AtoC
MSSDPLVASVAAKTPPVRSTVFSESSLRKRSGRSHRTGLADESYFVSSDPEMLRLQTRIDKISRFDIPVLILGETGTGKEVVARHIHDLSPRARAPFRKVNCAALPEALLESELFGYERGAFTGALRTKPGQFEMCDGGIIFLDEIGEMPPVLQAKLLHVLQDKSFSRLGGHDVINVDVRVIAATNVDIGEAIRSQRLREDLYYRLNAFTIPLPPLRDRCDDIPDMLEHFARQFASQYDCPMPTLFRELVDACAKYHWPGNIRELRGFVQRLIIQRDQEQALRELESHLPLKPIGNNEPEETTEARHEPKAAGRDLKALGRERKCAAEKAVIARILQETHYNRKVTARRLQISYKALFYKIHQYGLVWKARSDERDEASV